VRAGYIESKSESEADPVKFRLVYEPFRLPHILEIINNAFACVYLVIVSLFSFFPPATPVTARSMNYSVAVFGGLVVGSVGYYFAWGDGGIGGLLWRCEG